MIINKVKYREWGFENWRFGIRNFWIGIRNLGIGIGDLRYPNMYQLIYKKYHVTYI